MNKKPGQPVLPVSLQQKIADAQAILDKAIATYNPSHAFALFSGGYDSLVTTHLAMKYLKMRYPRLVVKAAHLNTGIGIPETRQFVRAACKQFSWPLVAYRSKIQYEDLVMKYGFPGPKSHRYMYISLKERAIEQLVREHKRFYRDKIMLITGVRREESQRRMGHVQPILKVKARVWTAPLLNWTKIDIRAYMQTCNLPCNDVVDILHMSGECLCGSYAQKGELAMISTFFPETGAYIKKLEQKVKAKGFSWGWEERPPTGFCSSKKEQRSLPGFTRLCSTCEIRDPQQKEEEQTKKAA